MLLGRVGNFSPDSNRRLPVQQASAINEQQSMEKNCATVMKSQRKTRHLYFGLTNFQLAMLILVALADGGLILILMRLLRIDLQALGGCYFVITFLLLIKSNLQLTRFGGSLKRGIPIWREPLSRRMGEPLRYMRQDVETDNGFIRIEGNLRLVFAHYPLWRTSWPYVAYIDLSVRSPIIEYRTGLGGLLFLIPFFIGFAPFVFIMMLLNHLVGRAGIRMFIARNAH